MGGNSNIYSTKAQEALKRLLAGDGYTLVITDATIDNSIIGGTTPASAAFTTVRVTSGAGDGYTLQSDASGNLSYIKNNLTATADPLVTDDGTKGYDVTSLWVNASSTEMFKCFDTATGAADWEKTTLTIDDLGTMAVQNSNAISVTGGTVTGLTSFDAVNASITTASINTLTVKNTISLGTSPTTGSFENGKMFYDETNKTLAVMIADDITLQVGQEDLIHVINTSGSDISDGQAVYMANASANLPTIELAKADAFSTSIVTAVCTQNIANGAEGLVNRRGRIHGLDTTGGAEAWSAGDILYLSSATAGALTNVVPTSAQIESRVGRVITADATVGVIYVDLFRTSRLTDLADADISASIVVDDVLKWNGTSWVNSSGVVISGSGGTTFYPDHTNILPIDAENLYQLDSLLKTPSGSAEVADVITVLSNTVIGVLCLYNTGLGVTKIDAGEWKFNTYASVSSVGGGSVSYLTRNIYHVVVESATISTTGSGLTRTATASSGTPFASGDADAATIDCGYVQTPKGIYQITGYTSATEVTIAVPTGYGNESGQAFSTWKKKFGVDTSNITNILTDYGLYANTTIQPEITIATTDKLGMMIFATSTNNRNVRFVHNGTEHYSHFVAPLVTLHNDLGGLNVGNYLHLTAAEYVTTASLSNGDTIARAEVTNASITTASITNLTTSALSILSSTGGLKRYSSEATIPVTASSIITVQANVPVSKILGCQLRVDEILAAGETWDAAYSGGVTQAIASDLAVATNTKVNVFFDENTDIALAGSEVDVEVTKHGGGVFTAQGNIRAIVYYELFTAMGDA